MKGIQRSSRNEGFKSGLVMWAGAMTPSLWTSFNVLASDQGLSVSGSTILML